MNPTRAIHRLLSRMPMKRKFLMQSTCVAAGIIILAVVAARLQYVDLNQTRKNGVNGRVEMAMNVVEDYARQAEAGELDEAAAQAAALDALARMQAAGGVDYFFVTDKEPRMLMHPSRPDLIGKPIADVLSVELAV